MLSLVTLMIKTLLFYFRVIDKEGLLPQYDKTIRSCARHGLGY